MILPRWASAKLRNAAASPRAVRRISSISSLTLPTAPRRSAHGPAAREVPRNRGGMRASATRFAGFAEFLVTVVRLHLFLRHDAVAVRVHAGEPLVGLGERFVLRDRAVAVGVRVL